jgi:hypothetical protein
MKSFDQGMKRFLNLLICNKEMASETIPFHMVHLLSNDCLDETEEYGGSLPAQCNSKYTSSIYGGSTMTYRVLGKLPQRVPILSAGLVLQR